MKEKVYEDGTKAAKTPLMIYYAKTNDNILWIPQWQNERQRSVNDLWSCIIGNLLGQQLRPFIDAVMAGFIGKEGASHSMPHSEIERQWSVNDFWSCK